MKRLYLGVGRVNRAIAAALGGDQYALSEQNNMLQHHSWDSSSKRFEFCKEDPGNFESFSQFEQYSEVYISPGVDPRRPFFRKVKDREMRELDLFCQKYSGKIFAITGTNGKSTLCHQLGEVFKRIFGSKKVFVGGNIGEASFEIFAAEAQPEFAILELSSFQLERLKTARFDLGILTNIMPDHLDRYDSFEDYKEQKFELVRRSKFAIFPSKFEGPLKRASEVPLEGEESPAELVEACVRLASRVWSFKFGQKYFFELPTLKHRFQRHESQSTGTVFVNDSKATNVASASFGMRRALKEGRPIIWALGGKSKGEAFTRLEKIEAAEELWLFGAAAQEIFEAVGSRAKSVRRFEKAHELVGCLDEIPEGSLFLFSPACASFDEFKNFEERGDFIFSAFEAQN